jgi:hypothetical protein
MPWQQADSGQWTTCSALSVSEDGATTQSVPPKPLGGCPDEPQLPFTYSNGLNAAPQSVTRRELGFVAARSAVSERAPPSPAQLLLARSFGTNDLTALHVGVTLPRSGAASGRELLEDALDACRREGVAFHGGRYRVLGSSERRGGGQGCVQFMADTAARGDVAVKFFFERGAFLREAALYADAALRGLMAATRAISANDGAGGASVSTAPGGYAFPPYIIIERGESLDEFRWLSRLRLADGVGVAADLLMTMMQALVLVASRVLSMHEAGWAHRDLKPSNVLRLPLQHSWTLIDFGCAARIGAVALPHRCRPYLAVRVTAAERMGRLAWPWYPISSALLPCFA